MKRSDTVLEEGRKNRTTNQDVSNTQDGGGGRLTFGVKLTLAPLFSSS